MRSAHLFTAATVSYLANCAVGTGVATRTIDTSNARWVHHALYISTSALSALAATSGLRPGADRSQRKAVLALLPAGVPLSLIPFLGSHSNRHIVVALTAAPFFAAGLIRAWR
ncbi:hypothetical protein ELQ92_11350 [Labedella populi]|uniref:Uncharacterized protein n=1 Tax=Labedella populi TaxID=2498850 RepID=A0A3S3ZPE2_9MICO|nr:hypothetical protein [Labedella populi]RWZ61561.1 hypothetical protein ELQ92_11350 [Labedella populi]